MKHVLTFAAVAEAATGLALVAAPALVVELLLGEQIAGTAVIVARVAGIAVMALAVACRPGPPLLGMLIYSGSITLYFAYLGLAGGLTALLLWPATALHAVLTLLLGRAWWAGHSGHQ
jgi:hypothetical protein